MSIEEMRDDILEEIHGHLSVQDTKLNMILEALHEDYRKTIGEDRGRDQ